MSGIIAAVALSAAVSGYTAYSSNKASGRQSDVAEQQVNLAKELQAEGAPSRQKSARFLDNFLQTGAVPFQLEGNLPKTYGLDQFMQTGQLPTAIDLAPTSAYNRDVLEQQFGRAREQAIGTTPEGGQLTNALMGLEGQRALGVTQLYAQENQQRNQLAQSLFGTGLDISRENSQRAQDLRRQLFANALGLGTSTAAGAQQGLANASQGFNNIASNALKATQMGLDTSLTGGALALALNRQNQYQQNPYQVNPYQQQNIRNDLNDQVFSNPNLY